MKKFLLLLPVLLMAGCATQFTRLSPLEQPRNANNFYPVEVEFDSNQQAMRLDTIKPYVLVDGELYPLHQVPLLNNRWEGFVSVPTTSDEVDFRFKFDYLYNNFGSQPKPSSAYSPLYKMKILDQRQ
ncbi:MAG TPA: hypothetical protein VGN23_14860 [Verrucomicrobiae bacterium]|jgi:hypothetical protein